MNREKRATMRDVANLAGVSIATVSRVINKESMVSAPTRRVVERAINELNYTMRTSNGSEKGIGRRIGIILPDITNPYFPCLLQGISQAARVYDAELVLGNANNELEIEKHHFGEMLENGVDGFIYIPFAEDSNPIVADLVEQGYPLVFLDRESDLEARSYVTSNNEEGSYQATTYLLSLGHRDILFISGPPYLSTSAARYDGYRRGLADFGFEADEALVVHGDTTQDSGARIIRELARQGPFPFTAIFASNDLMAFGAWKALEEVDYQVPEDISLIGYDDIPFASYISLTTIAQPAFEIGRNSLILLMDLIEERRDPPQRITLRDSLIIRRSCRRI